MIARIVKALIGLLFTSLIILLVAALYLVKFNHRTLLGAQMKDWTIKHPPLVRVLNLNEPGDARYVYMTPNPINVNLIFGGLSEPDPQAQTWIKNMILETTGNKAVINTVADSNTSSLSGYDDSDLNILRSGVMERFKDGTILNIFYLTLHKEQPTNVGYTLHKDTIFIFKSALDGLSEDPKTLQRLEQSTLMHEWGHLLGLEHLSTDNCVMSQKVEVFDKHALNEMQIPVTFCPESLNKLQQIKNGLN